MYNIGDIFYLDNEYSARAKFCNENGYVLKEIEPDEKGRRFQIQDLPELTEEQILEELRYRRETECFIYINRGVLWYNTLTTEQQFELDEWYRKWLDITDTYRNAYEQNQNIDIESIIPTAPSWLK